MSQRGLVVVMDTNCGRRAVSTLSPIKSPQERVRRVVGFFHVLHCAVVFCGAPEAGEAG